MPQIPKSFTELSEYYFLFGQVWIIADGPDAEQRIKEHPELPFATLAEIESVKSELDANVLRLKNAVQ